MTTADQPGHDQVTELRKLLRVSALLTAQDDQTQILKTVASAVAAVGGCEVVGVLLGQIWQEVGGRGGGLQPAQITQSCGQPGGGRVALPGVAWAWAYPIPVTTGFLVVSAETEAAESDCSVLQELAQLTGVALARADVRAGERAQTSRLRSANLALRRTIEIHDRLTQTALRGGGPEGIARALYELTGHPCGILDRFGNLITWAGPGPPGARVRAEPPDRAVLLSRATAASQPVRDEGLLISAARLAGAPVAFLCSPMPVRPRASLKRRRSSMRRRFSPRRWRECRTWKDRPGERAAPSCFGSIAGHRRPAVVSQALALGYDLGRPHQVAALTCEAGSRGDVEVMLHAVRKAVEALRSGWLMASRLSDVILLADADADVAWQRFHGCVEAQAPGLRCSIGVGGWCEAVRDYPRSYREAGLALRIQKAISSTDQVTVFNDLGVYRVLATEDDASSMEAFVQDWLGALLDYDAVHGAQLVSTLADFLECGGRYDAAATSLAVHRSTLKYRLRRIREVSGHDIGSPDIQFNLQVATRAWRTLLALRRS